MKKLTYKIMSLDDKPETLNYILYMLDALSFVEVVFRSTDPQQGLIYLNENEVDILLLDMDLGLTDINGPKFAAMLAKPPLIVACSAHQDFVFEAGDAGITVYISKSIQFRSLEKILKKIVIDVDRNAEEERRAISAIELKDSCGNNVLMKIEDIYYALICNTVLTVYMEDKEHEFKMSLREFKNYLPLYAFAKPHNSILVSLAKVGLITGKKVYMSGARKMDYFPITQEYNREFKHQLDLYRQIQK